MLVLSLILVIVLSGTKTGNPCPHATTKENENEPRTKCLTPSCQGKQQEDDSSSLCPDPGNMHPDRCSILHRYPAAISCRDLHGIGRINPGLQDGET